MQTKKIPIDWLIETLNARVNPFHDEQLNGVVEAIISDLGVLGLLDESKIDTDSDPKSEAEVDG